MTLNVNSLNTLIKSLKTWFDSSTCSVKETYLKYHDAHGLKIKI